MDFWSPTFEYEKRENGTIIMRQKDALPAYRDSLADYLDYWADTTPDSPWLRMRGENAEWQSITYDEARDRARCLGTALLEMGLGPEKPLVILSGNSLEHALLGISCTYVGIPYAPISPAYSLVSTDHEKLKAIAALLSPGAIYAEDGSQFLPALNAIADPYRTVICLRNLQQNQTAFATLLNSNGAASLKARQSVGPDTVVKYLFTSGSTGSPKAVINTNRMICSMQAMVRDCYRFLENEPPVVLDWAPWNHTAAGNKVFYMVLTNGGTYYIDDGNPGPGGMEKTVRNLREVSCTWYFNVPAGYDRLVEALEADADLANTFFARLRMLFYAGAGMAQHTWQRLTAIGQQATGRDVLIATGLGSTETAPFALAWTEPEEQAGNVGVPSRGLSLKLIENEDKLELRLKGPSITPGYYGDAKNTAAAFDDEGYYKMGDALRPVDPEDFSRGFYFAGRLAENFKLSTGTWVSVGAVRTALVDDMQGLIKDAVIVGENQAELGALVLLADAVSCTHHEEVRQRLLAQLEQHIKRATGSASRVKRLAILAVEPSFDRGEITEKGSLNQRALRSHHQELITVLFTTDESILHENVVVSTA